MTCNHLCRDVAKGIAFLLCFVLTNLTAIAQDTKPAVDPAERQVFFGEQHMHTRNSFDAFTAGVKQTWEDAYRFAQGEEIALSTTGQKMKRRTPYDFVAITDHSEYYGVLKDLIDPNSPLSKSEFAKSLQKMETDPAAAGPAVQKLIQTLVQNNPMKEYVTWRPDGYALRPTAKRERTAV